jgi:hypothetical protein
MAASSRRVRIIVGPLLTRFVQPFDRVCIELEACAANDFGELRK